MTDLDDLWGFSPAPSGASLSQQTSRFWETSDEAMCREPGDLSISADLSGWDMAAEPAMPPVSSWADGLVFPVPPLEASPIPGFPLDGLDEPQAFSPEPAGMVPDAYRWLEEGLGMALECSGDPLSEEDKEPAVATPDEDLALHQPPIAGSSGASSEQPGSGDSTSFEDASASRGARSHPAPSLRLDAQGSEGQEGPLVHSGTEEERSEGNASSAGKGSATSTGRELAAGKSQTTRAKKIGWAIDLQRMTNRHCRQYVQEFDRDLLAPQELRANNVEPLQRGGLAEWPVLDQSALGSDPFSEWIAGGEAFRSPCPEGCHCQACDLPKFDFRIPEGSPLAQQSLPPNPSTAGSKRPDMSARLAALVAATTTKPSSRPAILSSKEKRPLPAALAAEAAPPPPARIAQDPSGLPRGRSRRGRAASLARRIAADGTVRPPNPKTDVPLFSDPLVLLGDSPAQEPLLKKQLIAFAEAIAMDDQPRARFLMGVLRGAAHPTGDHTQRLTTYFLTALAARSRGNAAQLYNTPPTESPRLMEKAMTEFFDRLPYIEFSIEGINGAIFDAVAGERAVHVIDFGVWQGGQWPSLLSKLAAQPGGPPTLRITAVDCSEQLPPSKQAARPPSGAIGKRLGALAAQLGIPFEYRLVEFSVEGMRGPVLGLRDGEALAISCCMRLRSLFDASVVRCNPRDTVLQAMRTLKPRLVAISEMDVDHNGFFFMARVKEAWAFYDHVLESHDASFPSGSGAHLAVERFIFAQDILNVIGCEGLQRVNRSERLEQWQARLQKSGFRPVPIGTQTTGRLQSIAGRCAQGFSIGNRNGAITLNWKKRSLLALCAWKPLY